MKLLVGLAAMPFLAGIAMAGQPMPLSEAQMDKVTAGGGPSLEIQVITGQQIEINFGPTLFNVEQGPDVAGPAIPGVNHLADGPDALGGRVCNTSCTWFNT
jgi:hypothetical protein